MLVYHLLDQCCVDCSNCADNSTQLTASELPNTRNLKCTLQKKAVDVQSDDGDGRKKVALSTLGKKSVHMAGDVGLNTESNADERPQSAAQNLAAEKDKEKRKSQKQKAAPSAPAGRVSTRAELKRR